MAATTPGRNNLDTTTVGSAVIVKAVQGTGISLSSTGADAGTGDVTINLGTIAADSILGNTSASTAVPVALTALPFAYTGDVTRAADSNATVLAAGNAGNLNSGTLLAARMPALTGDVITTVGTVATTYNNAVPTTKAGLPTGGTANQVLSKIDATNYNTQWITPTGGGNVSNSGTPTVDQIGIWVTATTIKGVTALPAANFPALTGDITTTAGSLVTNIAANAVTLAEMAQMATDSILGRTTALTGNVEVLTALPWADTGDVTRAADGKATVLAAGNAGNLNSGTLLAARMPALTGDVTMAVGTTATTLAAGNAGNLNSGTLLAARMPALTGDVTTVAGAVATTIGANKVTLAMMATMATGSILGRATAATGNVEVLTTLPFAYTGDVTRPANSNVTTLANLPAAMTVQGVAGVRGDILYYSSTGWAKLAAGTSGNQLTTNGAGADPTWSAPGGGGGVTSLTGTSPIVVSPTTGAAVASLNVGVDHAFTAAQTITLSSTVTNTVGTLFTLSHNTSGTVAAGFGTGLLFLGENNAVDNVQMGRLSYIWSTVGATPSAALRIEVVSAGTNAGRVWIYDTGGITNAVGDPGAGVINANTGFKLGGAEFPIAANGIVKRTAANTYAAAAIGDIQGLLPTSKVVFLTAASGTYTPTSGVRAIYVECVGGGGGGGGALGGSSLCGVGAGGGGGGYSASYITSPASSYAYVCGVAVTGGAATGANGTAGNPTTLGTTVVVANGGSGGTGGTAASSGGVAGGAGGVAGTGDFANVGGDGQSGYRISGTQGIPGAGGSSFFAGLRRTPIVGAVGLAGFGYGGGGSGAMSFTATGFAGGNGNQGCIRIWEFF
jgi:hypothetical protein